MGLFNAVQIVALFIAMPFIIGWLHRDPFQFAVAVKWLCGIGYVVAAGWIVSLVWQDIEPETKR